MIEPLLFFALGMLSAAIVWLMLLPAFWRRAIRLTRRALEQNLPLTTNEILAERDRLRARFAVEAALGARREAKARNEVLQARAETGERLRAEAAFHATIAGCERDIAAREAEIAALRAKVERLETAFDALDSKKQLADAKIAGLLLQRDAEIMRHEATMELAEERRRQWEERSHEAENLRLALAEETRRAAHLRGELQAREIALREAGHRLASLENERVVARIRRGEDGGDPRRPA